jgi:putative tryptophan/tyrosine transport system substrate-binding protein
MFGGFLLLQINSSSITATLVAMQQETHTIPIVFAQVFDSVGAGFMESLSHPGGNITGFVSFEYSMAGK